jgi:crotonobetainyl-CoA:carnitine CoA-transferase CaiB-like acyl-CoA transferase
LFSDVRVLDCSDPSGSLAGKILGDLGADVVKLEPPGGDRAARGGPFLGGTPDPERSLPWLAVNTSKRGVTLSLAHAPGRELFLRLLESADVLLETERPGDWDALGLGDAALRARCPRLVHCSITPFGRSGPRARWRAGDLVAVAMGGNASQTGDPDRPPLRCSLPTAFYHAAPEAAAGIAAALYARDESGRGQHVDVSLQECQAGTLLGAPGLEGFRGPGRRAGARLGRTREIWRARDGFVSFGLRGGPARAENLRATVAYMAETGMAPAWLLAVDWARYDPGALSDAELARLEDAFGAFFAARSMRELYEEALRRRILLAPCNDAREIAEHPQLRAREFFVTLDYPELGASLAHPARFAADSLGACGVRRRAPRIGEHNAELYAELGLGARELEKLAAEGVV